MHATSDLVMSLVLLLYGTECEMQLFTFLMVLIDHSMIEIWRPLAHMFQLVGLMCSRK